jgi:hypothetical protein
MSKTHSKSLEDILPGFKLYSVKEAVPILVGFISGTINLRLYVNFERYLSYIA